MIRYILLTLTALVLHTGSLFAQSAQPREKSEAEIFMQQMAKEVKSNEIDYAYISTSMFRQLLSQALSIVDSDIKEALGVDNILSSVMYMRRFMSTGREGYELLHKAMQPFLEEEEELILILNHLLGCIECESECIVHLRVKALSCRIVETDITVGQEVRIRTVDLQRRKRSGGI